MRKKLTSIALSIFTFFTVAVAPLTAQAKAYPSEGILPETAVYQGKVPVTNFNTNADETVTITLHKNKDEYELIVPLSDCEYQMKAKEIPSNSWDQPNIINIDFYDFNGFTGNWQYRFTYNSAGDINVSGIKLNAEINGIWHSGFTGGVSWWNSNIGWLKRVKIIN